MNAPPTAEAADADRARLFADVALPVLGAATLVAAVEGWLHGAGRSDWLYCVGIEAMFGLLAALPVAVVAALVAARGGRGPRATARRRAAGLGVGLSVGFAAASPLPASFNWAVALLFAAAAVWLLRARLPLLPAPLFALGLLPAMIPFVPHGGDKIVRGARQTTATAPAEAPSLLLISVDTLRADRTGTEHRGRSRTPFLDTLAAEGVHTRVTSSSNQTGPGHIGMLSGTDYLTYRAQLNGRVFDPRVPALAEELRQRGYRTGAVISNAVIGAQLGFARGFEVYDQSSIAQRPLHRAFGGARKWSVRWQLFRALKLERKLLAPMLAKLASAEDWREMTRGGNAVIASEQMFAAIEDDAPFFAFVHMIDPHAPYEAVPPHLRSLTTAEEEAVLDSVESRDFHKLHRYAEKIHHEGDPRAPLLVSALSTRYDEEVLYIDECIEAVVAQARAATGDRPLWIVMTSDHGEEFLEHGRMGHARSLAEELLQVPLYLHGEGLVELGQVPDNHEDLVRYLYTAMIGDDEPWAGLPTPSDVGISVHGYSTHLAVRMGDWKLLLEADEAFGEYRPTALFDLGADPMEDADLLAAEPERVAEMMEALKRHRESIPITGPAAAKGELDQAVLEELGYVD